MGDIELNTPDRLQYNFFPADGGYVRFKVRATNDAHIALTTAAAESEPMYEVFIGGWGNQRSVIRKNRQKPDVAEAPTPNILNGGEFRSFWIRWDNNTISVGCENNSQPFISWRDDYPVPVRYVGVCTGWGASGSWIIEKGAPLPGFGSSVSQYPGAPQYPSAPQYPGAAPQYPGAPPQNYPGAPPQSYPGAPPQSYPGAPPQSYPGAPLAYNPSQPLNQPFGGVPPNQFGGSGGYANWVPSNAGNVPPRAFVGGNDANGEPLYVVRCHFQGALLPGKLVQSHRTAYVPWGGVENAVHDYEVLCDFGGRWVPCSGNGIPPNAVSGGRSETGEPLFVGRAHHEGSLTVGKVQPSHSCLYIPFGGQELTFPQFEILIN